MMRTLLAAGTLCVAVGTVNAQNIVVNGGFETPAVLQAWAQRLPGETFGGWTVDNVGSGIVQVATFASPAAAEGAQCLELNYYQACGVSQTVATTPGAYYRLSFLMAGQNNIGPNVKHMRVDWNGAQLVMATWDRAATGGVWQAHAYTVAATSTATRLHFFGMEDVDGGPYLDAVSLVPTCGPADLGSTGGVHQPDGVLDNNDFVVFVDDFFGLNPQADMGSTGGVVGGDGAFDNNDFVVFVDAFFNGCA